MKVYLAAPWVTKAAMAAVQDQWEAAGFEVVSRWIKKHPAEDDSKTEYDLAREAAEDVADLWKASTFVIYNTAKSEGKACELGMALERGMGRIVLVGDRHGNVFYHLPMVEQVFSTDEAIALLR